MGTRKGYRQSAEHVRKRVAARVRTQTTKPRPVSREWLVEHYHTKGLDCVRIGRIVKRDPKTVWAWMKHYGIGTRPRGNNVGNLQRGRAPGFKLTGEHKQALRSARMEDGHVPYLKDGKHHLKGKRGAETPNWRGGCTPERQAFYSSEEWRSACKTVWARANATCERCGAKHNSVGRRGTFHVHHVVSFAVRELRADPINLALLCATCHRFVHSKKNTAREFLAGGR